jgi:hypothetical protein
MVRQSIMAAGACCRVYSPRGRQESEKGKGTGNRHNFKDMPLMTHFLQLCPTPKVSTTFQIVPNSTTSWGPNTQCMSLCRIFYSQTITPYNENLLLIGVWCQHYIIMPERKLGIFHWLGNMGMIFTCHTHEELFSTHLSLSSTFFNFWGPFLISDASDWIVSQSTLLFYLLSTWDVLLLSTVVALKYGHIIKASPVRILP